MDCIASFATGMCQLLLRILNVSVCLAANNVYVLELQVLRKFLDVFSSFDWDSMALSLQGPIPLSAFDDPEGMLWVLEPS